MQRIIARAIVEVRYRNGIVYLDHCGSLMVRLESALGEPFVGSVPEMVRAELVSRTEQLVVHYGPQAFSVTQNWAVTPVRVEQVAREVWKHVADVLGVRSEVTRFGVRFLIQWPVASVDAGESCLADAGLFSETTKWSEIFGLPTTRSFTAAAVLPGTGGRLRATINTVKTEAVGELPRQLEGLVPDFAVQMDVDHVYPGEETYSLGPGQLADFIRIRWEATRAMASRVEDALGFATSEKEDG